MRATPPSVHVIVLNWNQAEETIACLRGFLQTPYSNYRFVVVDNGSEDRSAERIEAWVTGQQVDAPSRPTAERLRLIRYDEASAQAGGDEAEELQFHTSAGVARTVVLVTCRTNHGFTGGCNLGVNYALRRDADYVLLLNNDARPQPSALPWLVSVAQRADAAVVGATIIDGTHTRQGRKWPACLFGLPEPNTADLTRSYWPVAAVDGCGFLLRRDLLERRISECSYVFDPRFFMYWEDTDLCLYARSRGFACVVASNAVVRHSPATSSGGMLNPRSSYYVTRNRIFVAHRWLSDGERFAFNAYYTPSRLLLQLVRIRRQSLDTAMAVLAGIRDGYRGVSGRWERHGGPA